MADQGGAAGNRWVVLAAFMGVNLTIQTLWISYAPISSTAQQYYGVSAGAIGVFSISFMVAYLPVSFIASHAIAHHGLRSAVGFGALLAGLAGVARGFAGPSYTLALLATVAAAVAQPFLLNAWTTLSTQWFSYSQRATAVSLVTLSNLLGAGIGLALTPVLVQSMSVAQVQLVYGAFALLGAVAFLLVVRDGPVPAEPGIMAEPGAAPPLALVGVRHALSIGPFVAFLAMAFLTMGVFNGLSTWIEEILGPRGFSETDAGNTGAMLLVGGVVGSMLISTLSDRSGLRVPYLALALGLSAPPLLMLALVDSLAGLLVASFLLGFFMTSALPVGLQYAAEITHPTPAGTSNGLTQLAGQSSVVFVILMSLTQTSSGSFTPSLSALAALLLVGGVLAWRLPEPGLVRDRIRL